MDARENIKSRIIAACKHGRVQPVRKALTIFGAADKDLPVLSMLLAAHLMPDVSGPGYMVVTSDGQTGRTRHADPNTDTHILVYLEDGTKRRCKVGSLNLLGYVD